MDLDAINHLLTTTRSVRKRLDLQRPVEPEVIQDCIDFALQAPNGGNRGRYHFIVVTDPMLRGQIAEFYRKAANSHLSASKEAYGPRIFESAIYLSNHLHEIPVHIIPCIEGRVEKGDTFQQATLYGSILPAAWSLMLALRSRGLGAAWTTLHIAYETEVAAVLGIPEGITQAALLPVAHYTGDDFRPAKRVPGRERTYWDKWAQTHP